MSASVSPRFFLLACAGFASMCSMRVTDAMLPALASQFGTTTGAAAAVVSVFVIAYGLCQLVYGPLGDRYGKTRVVRAAVAAAAVINLALMFSPSLSAMTGLRLLAGAAAAGIVPLCLAFIGDAVPYAERQAVLAQFLTGLIGGMIVGQWAGGVFADFIGWRWAFACLAVIFSGVALAMWRNLPTAQGAETSAASFVQQVKRVLAIAWARKVGLYALVEGALVFSSLVFVPSYLHARFDVSLTLAGALVTLFGVGGLLYATSARRFVSRFGERGLSIYGGALQGLGLAMLAFGPQWQWAPPACFLFGLGFYMLHNTLQTHATQMAPQARGTGVALFACMLFLGQSLGISGVALIVDRWGAQAVFLISLVGLPLLGAAFARSLSRR
ncbi:MAG: MFS transporter [Pigmentiphaga sp.]